MPDAPVGTIRFGPEIDAVVEHAASLLGDSEVTTWLRESYRPGETLGSGFARLFARLFAEWGVILLDPADKEFHEVAKPLFRAAIERSPELDEALLARGKALEAAGYHQQVKVTSATTLLFEVKNGARTVVRRKANGGGAEFVVGKDGDGKHGDRMSLQQLLERIDEAPENFNPNVLFRPVVQDLSAADARLYGRSGGGCVLRAGRCCLRKIAGTNHAGVAAVFGDVGRAEGGTHSDSLRPEPAGCVPRSGKSAGSDCRASRCRWICRRGFQMRMRVWSSR